MQLNLTFRVKKFISQYPNLLRFSLMALALCRSTLGVLKGQRGAGDYLHSTFSLIQRSPYISGRPVNVTIEPTNVCNAKCPVCETGAAILGREKGFMKLEQFQTIIDKIASHTNTLMFYFMGEPFLNKSAYDMIRYAKEKRIPFITSCTNGDMVNPEKLVESGIDEINFQIGGLTHESHAKYRAGSNLDKIIENLRETVRLKNERRAKMRIVCGFILMRHNEHEVAEFKRSMSEIGVDEALVISPCVRTIEQGKEMLPTDKKHWIYNSEAFERGELRPKVLPHNECPWIYYSLTIQVNGDVVACCRDAQGQFVMGNILEQNLEEIWNGQKFMQFRKKLHTDQKQISICRLCSGYGVSALN
jgi:radical SAM protein with 4Fe4S-binding SPASM domain